jgi:hypothetical protein
VAVTIAVIIAIVLVGGQFVAPSIATSVLRQRLAKDGKVLSARVSAFPWVQLIWHHADRATATMADYDAAPGHIERLLHQADGIGTVDVSIGVVRTGLLTLHAVTFTKQGDELVGVGTLDLSDLQAALPIVRSLTPIRDSNGQVVLRGTASVLGVQASVDVVIAARDGKLVVAPSGLLGAFATLTLYDDPEIHVQSVTATTVPGGLRFVTRGKLT